MYAASNEYRNGVPISVSPLFLLCCPHQKFDNEVINEPFLLSPFFVWSIEILMLIGFQNYTAQRFFLFVLQLKVTRPFQFPLELSGIFWRLERLLMHFLRLSQSLSLSNAIRCNGFIWNVFRLLIEPSDPLLNPRNLFKNFLQVLWQLWKSEREWFFFSFGRF